MIIILDNEYDGNHYRRVQINCNSRHINDVMIDIKAALLAYGISQGSLDDYFGEV